MSAPRCPASMFSVTCAMEAVAMPAARSDKENILFIKNKFFIIIIWLGMVCFEHEGVMPFQK